MDKAVGAGDKASTVDKGSAVDKGSTINGTDKVASGVDSSGCGGNDSGRVDSSDGSRSSDGMVGNSDGSGAHMVDLLDSVGPGLVLIGWWTVWWVLTAPVTGTWACTGTSWKMGWAAWWVLTIGAGWKVAILAGMWVWVVSATGWVMVEIWGTTSA